MLTQQELSSIAAKFTQEVQPLLEDMGKADDDLNANEWFGCFKHFLLEGIGKRVSKCRDAYEHRDKFADKDTSEISFEYVNMFLADHYWPIWRKREKREEQDNTTTIFEVY